MELRVAHPRWLRGSGARNRLFGSLSKGDCENASMHQCIKHQNTGRAKTSTARKCGKKSFVLLRSL